DVARAADDHLGPTVPLLDGARDPDALALVQPLRLAWQIGDERDQQDDAKRRGIVGSELEHAGIRLESRPYDVALDRGDVACVVTGRLPGDDGLGARQHPDRSQHRRTDHDPTARDAPPHRRTALAGDTARTQGVAASFPYRVGR